MDNETTSIIPNTTQIPHLIIREWMPLLKDVELRVLLVVADQTLGWIEDPQTKRRKEKDWISQGLLMKKISRSDRAIQSALKKLVDELRIVQAHDEQGDLLDSPQKRMKCGGKIFYRLSLSRPQPPTPEESSGAEAPALFDAEPPKNLRAKNFRATKETTSTEIIKSCRTSELAGDNEKETNPTRFFFWKFDQLSRAIRNKKPTFVKHKDGQLIVHALRHLTPFQLEMELIWFLERKPTMRPCFGAALCKEVIGDFIKASRREYGFYGSLEQTAMRFSERGWKTGSRTGEMTAMADALARLKQSLVAQQTL